MKNIFFYIKFNLYKKKKYIKKKSLELPNIFIFDYVLRMYWIFH